MTQASSRDDTGDDVVMREDNADENRAGHPSSSWSDSRRGITTKRARDVRDAQANVNEQHEQHVPGIIWGKTTLSEHPFAVTTHDALDGYREKTVRVANVENNTLNCVSISSAGALDMTHCDFIVRPERDEMRHITGSSEPDVIIGPDKDQNRGCKKKDTDHMEFLCELYEAQAACGGCCVHELMSEVNTRMKCVTAQVVEVETDWVTVRRRTKQRRQQGRDEGSAKSGGRGFRGMQIFVKMDVAPSDKVSEVMRRIECDSKRDMYRRGDELKVCGVQSISRMRGGGWQKDKKSKAEKKRDRSPEKPEQTRGQEAEFQPERNTGNLDRFLNKHSLPLEPCFLSRLASSSL